MHLKNIQLSICAKITEVSSLVSHLEVVVFKQWVFDMQNISFGLKSPTEIYNVRILNYFDQRDQSNVKFLFQLEVNYLDFNEDKFDY